MKKIFPYISILAGILVIGLYMYSTVSHNKYIKEQEKKIVQDQNSARNNVDANKILWKLNSGELIYKTSINENSELVLTDLRTDSVEILYQIKSKNSIQYNNNNNFIFWILDDDHASVIIDDQIVQRLTAVY